MALTITEGCINCDLCEPECPNGAISESADTYVIDPDNCTECVGHFNSPMCLEMCPADCVIQDIAHVESMGQLLAKFENLIGVKA